MSYIMGLFFIYICLIKYDKWENSLYRNFYCYELIIYKNLKLLVIIIINVCIYIILFFV